MDCFYHPHLLVFWQMQNDLTSTYRFYWSAYQYIFSLVLPRNPLFLILNDNTFHFHLCLVSCEQKTNCPWKILFTLLFSFFSSFSLPQHNWNSLFSSVVLETKIKIVLTILIAISCSADITRLSYLLVTQESTSCIFRAFLKCSEFLFYLYMHLLLLEKQEGVRKIFNGNHYAASWPTGFEASDPEIWLH